MIHECVPCQKLIAKACSQEAGPLPRERVCQCPVFSVTGTDYLGPLYCHNLPNMKFYVCLFTCGVVRAIHLELTSALSSSEFLHAFRRFAARRGLPKVLYSDNAKTFTGSVKALQSVYCSKVSMVGRMVGKIGSVCQKCC